MQFCVRDDDTSFFTSPDDLECAYGEIGRHGPISLAIIPFCRAGSSRGLPDTHRMRWSIHPLHENIPLVDYLRAAIRAGRFEAMLHGYHHDEPDGVPEFAGAHDPHREMTLQRKVADGRRYLEDLLDAPVRVFVPPHNAIGRAGLRAVAAEGLHLGGTAGIRAGWSLISRQTWRTWRRLRRWRNTGASGIPWILDLGDHREIPGVSVTPVSRFDRNATMLESALARDGVFCAATHYWELDARSVHPGDGTVRDHLRRLVDRALGNADVVWRSVGEVVSDRRVGL
jgi:hypothetical protein